jgi:metal-responsive CopG/Arc/MetJ family transcriptional regulator
MNTSTINISLPTSLLNSAREESKKYGFASISEYIRQAIRSSVYGIRKDGLTINGFTPEFEEMALKNSKSSAKNDILLETDDDFEKHFLGQKTYSKISKDNVKSVNKRKLRVNAQGFTRQPAFA